MDKYQYMSDIIVKLPIDEFLRSTTEEEARVAIGITTGGDDASVSTKVRAASASWDTTFTTVNANSATWNSSIDDVPVSTKVRAASASWDSTFTIVNSNSATTWNYQGVDRLPLSGGNLTGNLSSNSSGIFTTLSATDATFTGAISAASYLGLPPATGDDTSASTKVRSASSYWDSNYTTVNANSASWGVGGTGDDLPVSTKVRASSAAWDSTFTTVNAESASWVGGGGTVNALPLSGGNLTGPLSSNSSGTFTTFYASNYLGLPAFVAGIPGVFTQTFSSTDTVVVNHNSNCYPIVQVLDDVGAVFIPASISHTSLSSTTLSFYEARSGTVLCSIVGNGKVELANVTDNYTLTLSDAGRYLRVNNSNNAAKTITIPAQVSVSWELGTSITIKNTSNYTMNISGSNGVTIYTSTSSFGPLGVTQIVNVGTNAWDIL